MVQFFRTNPCNNLYFILCDPGGIQTHDTFTVRQWVDGVPAGRCDTGRCGFMNLIFLAVSGSVLVQFTIIHYIYYVGVTAVMAVGLYALTA